MLVTGDEQIFREHHVLIRLVLEEVMMTQPLPSGSSENRRRGWRSKQAREMQCDGALVWKVMGKGQDPVQALQIKKDFTEEMTCELRAE